MPFDADSWHPARNLPVEWVDALSVGLSGPAKSSVTLIHVSPKVDPSGHAALVRPDRTGRPRSGETPIPCVKPIHPLAVDPPERSIINKQP